MTKTEMAFTLLKTLYGSKEGRAMLSKAQQSGPDGIKKFMTQMLNAIPDPTTADPKDAKERFKAVFNQAKTPTSELLAQGLVSDAIPAAVSTYGNIKNMQHGMLGNMLRALKSKRPSDLNNHNALDDELEAVALQTDLKGNMTKAITDAAADVVQTSADRVFNDRRYARQAAEYAYSPISAGAADYFGRQLTYANRTGNLRNGGKS